MRRRRKNNDVTGKDYSEEVGLEECEIEACREWVSSISRMLVDAPRPGVGSVIQIAIKQEH